MKSHHLKMITIWLLLMFVTFLLPISMLALPECNFPAIFNFGDSNSDTGTLAAMYGQLPFPYGETYFHHSAGRYSDGRLVIDFIGTYYILPYPHITYVDC